MQCRSCGAEVLDSASSCLLCGRPVFKADPKDIQAAANKRVAVVMFLLLLLVLMAPRILKILKPERKPPVLMRATGLAILQSLTIEPGGNSYRKFPVPPGVTNVLVSGPFTAIGGRDNDIEALVMSEDGFTEFQNKHPVKFLYDSGRVSAGTVRAVLEPGKNYVIMFNNGFPHAASKNVKSDIYITFNKLQE